MQALSFPPNCCLCSSAGSLSGSTPISWINWGEKKRLLPAWRHFLTREKNQRKARSCCALQEGSELGFSQREFSHRMFLYGGKAPICQPIVTSTHPEASDGRWTSQKGLNSSTSPGKWRRGTECLSFEHPASTSLPSRASLARSWVSVMGRVGHRAGPRLPPQLLLIAFPGPRPVPPLDG